MKIIVSCIAVFVGAMAAAPGAAASFDCAKASNIVEHLICGDSELSKLDEHMANNYTNLLKTYPAPDALKLRQKQWLKRRTTCEQEDSDVSITKCLKESYTQRLHEIEGLAKADLPCPELPIIKSESEKAQCLKRWLARHPLELNSEHMSVNDQKFCTEIYQALASASSEVHYIEPVLRTEDPQDPGLAKYRQCRDFEPAGLGYDYYGIDNEAHGFRLYRAELDGNPNNGLEEYLYEEESWGSMKDGHTQYVRVEFTSDECSVEDSPNVDPQEPRLTSTSSGGSGLNSLISFRGRYYIYDLKGYIGLAVPGFDTKRRKFSGYQCSWLISDQLLNGQTKGKE